MPRFRYIAVDQYGASRREIANAADARQLAVELRRQGLAPTLIESAESVDIGPRVSDVQSGPRWQWPGKEKPKRAHVMVFTRQLATLLRAGMPLVRGLDVLARQEAAPGWRAVVEDLGSTLRTGGSLSEAVAKHPRLFDRLYGNMLKAGEAGGALAEVLDRLATFLEKSHRLRAKLRAAMVYPVLVLVVALGILMGLLLWVVPKFEQIFADLLKGAPLPLLTQIVIGFSRAVQTHWLAVAGGLFLIVLIWKIWQGSLRSLDIIRRLPVLGDLALKSAVARLARTLGTLLASGVPILSALQITRDACAHQRISVALTGVHEQVKAGATVAGTFGAIKIFPPLVTSLVEVGEHTGELPAMLGRIADIYDDEVDQAITGLTSLIEPVLILMLALVVGTIVIALFLPIVRIVQLLT